MSHRSPGHHGNDRRRQTCVTCSLFHVSSPRRPLFPFESQNPCLAILYFQPSGRWKGPTISLCERWTRRETCKSRQGCATQLNRITSGVTTDGLHTADSKHAFLRSVQRTGDTFLNCSRHWSAGPRKYKISSVDAFASTFFNL